LGNFLHRLWYYFLVFKDRQTPWIVKLILGAGLLYILLPVDLLSDTVPFLGWLDDMAIVTFIVALALRLVPREVTDKVRKRMSGPGR
jgi:uncharacterized membrane protein YkvA (DUF1232 family)